MNGAYVVLICGEGGECLNRSEFQKGVSEFGRGKRWVVRRDSVAGSKGADGVIAYGVEGRVAAQTGSLGGTVVWGQSGRPGGEVGVVLDEREIGRMGALHFAEAGFSRLGFVLGKWESCGEMWRGFWEAAVESGLEEPEATRVMESGRNGMDSVREISEWLTGFSEPVGVMAPADRWGNDVLYAAEAAGLKVPEQVAVLGVGNDEVECGLGPVGLSSIDVGARQQGELAARVLNRMMEGKALAADEVEMEPAGVSLRMSSDVQAVPHLKASMALRFIRRNYGEFGLSVDRVAEEVGMSRRGLEDAFRNHLQKGIGRTITEMRIRFAKEMLAGTRRNVGEVAVLVGFQNSQYFHRCFSRIVGMTPAQFRKLRTEN